MSSFDAWQVGRRADVVRWVLFLVFGLLGLTFFKVQVFNHEQLKLESATNRLRALALEAPRGDILDRNGAPIAVNFPGYSIKLLAPNEDSLRAVIKRMSAFIPADSINPETVVRRWRLAKYQPAMVFASGEYRVVATLEEHRADLPGLVIQVEPRRWYPDSTAVAHLVGYVGEVNAQQIADSIFPGAAPGQIVGKQGIERTYDSTLRGRQGNHYVEVSASGRTIREALSASTVAPISGEILRTTLDLKLQQFVDSMWQHDMPEKRGAMVAMTPKGEILAYYSNPSFNPNDFIGKIDRATWRELNDDPDLPMYNRVIQGRFPPASPFKLVLAAIGLRRGLVTMDSYMKLGCDGSYTYGSRTWKCHKKAPGHGRLTLREAIATSCDVYFYQLGQMIGADNVMHDAVEMGFAARTGIDLANEERPVFPQSMKSYVNGRGQSTWNNGEILNLSIGQGANAQTLINMVSFYAALAGDGIKREPYIVRPRANAVEKNLGLTPEQLAGLRLAMLDVVNQGTATAGLAGESGIRQYEIAGKTGSGQVSNQQDIAWFIAFAPESAPKIVIGIEVEEGLHGGLIAKYAVRAMVKYLTGESTKADFHTVTEDLHSTGDSISQATPPPQGRKPPRR